MLTSGTKFGPYEIESALGAGGMGEVYRARDTRLDRTVAIKVLPAQWMSNADARHRFQREAKAISSLNHPHICQLFDLGTQDERDYLVLEFLEGETLADRIQRGPLPLAEVLRVGIEMADALEAAHSSGVLHRDLKPANVFVTQRGHAKVLDFGLAKSLTTAQQAAGASADAATITTSGGLTSPGSTVGTLAYMSPEQVLGKELDARSDIFSFGVVLYEAATGKRLFQGVTPAAISDAILHYDPPRPSTVNPLLPAELDSIILRAIEKQPGKRQSSGAALRDQLQALQLQLSSGPAPVSLGVVVRRPPVVIAAVLLVIIAIAAGFSLQIRARHIRWARNVALPQISDLVQRDKDDEALPLAEDAARYIPDDPTLKQLLEHASRLVNIHSDPEGADIYMRRYSVKDAPWVHLGKAPILGKRLPRFSFFAWRAEMPGYAAAEEANIGISRETAYRGASGNELSFKLYPVAAAPAGMVHVPGGTFALNIPGFDALPATALEEYWIDKFEVTNRDYKKFLAAGAYGDPKYWKQPFLKDGKPLSFQLAMSIFRDKTGRPGPATWEGGDYPDGQADYPVTGVSWYEAAAYAEFVGKSLPSIYHWNKAAGTWAMNYIAPASNFDVHGLAPVGKYPSLGPYGTYDQGGNAKEWCWNAAGAKRYILGGAWNEPAYMFTDADAQSPFVREPNYGFRLAKYSTTPAASSLADVEWPKRDYGRERPAADNVFAIYKGMYAYDKTPLNAKVEAVDDTLPDWRREKITFDAAYGNERVIAYLFLPRHGRPPFQTVVYFPGSNVISERSSEKLDWHWSRLDFIIKSGRAVVYPIYKSTYERGDKLDSDYQAPTAFYRDHVIDWSKDLGRTLDYIQTRPELDHQRIAYFGLSWGAALGPVMTATNDRIRVNLLLGGGLEQQKTLPECDPFNFAPRVKQPTLMVNGRYDYFFPVETSQDHLFRTLGSAPPDKRHVIFEAGHVPPNDLVMKEVLSWLDKYLGTP
ncbi:MAG: bifunctional serine/threonine-protein kinase/formylglycine-generating enzyme family protein [Terriglobales bacterium]